MSFKKPSKNQPENFEFSSSSLKAANDIISKQKSELSEALSGQQAVLKEYEVAEAEAAELHEFLHAEKSTLNEALKESEQEVVDERKSEDNNDEY